MGRRGPQPDNIPRNRIQFITKSMGWDSNQVKKFVESLDPVIKTKDPYEIANLVNQIGSIFNDIIEDGETDKTEKTPKGLQAIIMLEELVEVFKNGKD